MKKKGITLIALVVTIIVLLILVGITLTVTLGPDGIIEKSKRAKIDNRYGSIMDKVKLRETALEIAFEKGEEGEDDVAFIRRLEREGLKIEEDEYKAETKTLTVAGIYTIHIADASAEGRRIWQRIQNLPSVEEHPEMAPMTLIIRTTTSPETVTIPIYKGQGLTIDWGDGTTHTTVTTNNPEHSYQTAGDYTLKIIGKATDDFAWIGSNTLSYINTNIVGIKYWGENDFKDIGSFGQNLQGQIPRPSRNSFENVRSFYSTFYNCSGLTGSIPSDLFSNCSKVRVFQYVFRNCIGLTGNIPNELFLNCLSAESFYETFNNCIELTGSIPSNLFSNCPNVTNFDHTFSNCSSLIGNIPNELFINCPNVKYFDYTFYNCSSLTGNIPNELFINCSNVKHFNATFSNCSGLTGSIPSDLFSDCTSVISFSNTFSKCKGLTGNIPATLFSSCLDVNSFNGTFFSCKNLTGSIPPTLFSNCPDVTTFRLTFSACSGLTGDAPDLWNTHSSADGLYCFQLCNFSNQTSIPDNWK